MPETFEQYMSGFDEYCRRPGRLELEAFIERVRTDGNAGSTADTGRSADSPYYGGRADSAAITKRGRGYEARLRG